MADDSSASWRHEKESAWLYRAVAAVETDPVKSALFLKLADAAEQQADKWLRHHPEVAATFVPSLRARVVARLVRAFGPRPMRSALAAMKMRGLSVYTAAAAAQGHAMPTSVAQIAERHQNLAGNNLRAAVFGANDGLVSNAALVLGVAGAGAQEQYVLLSGIAG
ncbi:MAG: VIT1/CCC1 transporter family protein, partial [Steroidobacteraceae bacterium]|nr:VIT1/CCC1 transporter family protein [Steroidobacteraceae bacterium]